MTFANLALTLVTVFAIAVGQVLFKCGALQANAMGEGASVVARYGNRYLFAAVILYGGATVLWVYVLQRVPLSVAYPLMGLAFVVVPVLAALVLGESLTLRSLVGGAVIAAGIWIGHKA